MLDIGRLAIRRDKIYRQTKLNEVKYQGGCRKAIFDILSNVSVYLYFAKYRLVLN